MRRWLAIFLLFVLPIQLSWAVVAGYESHASAGGESEHSHFGHHEHFSAHHGDVPAPDASAADRDAAVPSGHDCGQCHGNLAALLPSDCAAARQPVANDARAGGPLFGATVAPPRPERPQWSRLA